ncbi:MAG: DUF3137 domain-containing protein [Spirochaetota bacterium]
MKTLEELRTFYETVLIDDLTVLEKKRKAVVKKVLISAAAISTAVLAVAGILLVFLQGEDLMFLVFPVVIGVMGIHFAVGRLSRNYVSSFKQSIISSLVTFVDPDLQYDPQAYIPVDLFKSSELFRRRIDRYRGDDLVWGRVGETAIRFSELHAEYKTTTTDSKGRRKTHWHTIFKGLFFIGDFNKPINGQTFVLPDTAERIFGSYGQIFQSYNKTFGELIRLEDPDFEKEFVVYGTDQIEARYILTTSLMARITDFRRKAGKRIYLAFIGSNLFIAISFSRNLFEPRLFKTVLDFSPVQEYFEDMRLAVGIVEELNLNTRIWNR